MRTKQHYSKMYAFSALTLLVGRQEGHPACKKTDWWDAGVFICLERSADLHTAQLMPLPLTVSCSSKSRLVLPFWYWLTRVVPSAGLMPTEARGNYLHEAPYLRETKTYLNCMHASESTLDSSTASHSSRHDMLAVISSRYQYGPFLFFCCRSYVKLLD